MSQQQTDSRYANNISQRANDLPPAWDGVVIDDEPIPLGRNTTSIADTWTPPAAIPPAGRWRPDTLAAILQAAAGEERP